MNTIRRVSFRTGAFVLLLTSLVIAACGPATQPAAKSTAVAQPTQVARPTTPPQPTAAPSEPTPGPQSSTLGRALKSGDLSLRPSNVRVLSQSGGQSPKAGDEFLIIQLLAENTGKSATVNIDPSRFALVEPNGETYPMMALSALIDAIHAQTLKPGAKVEGTLGFEVPSRERVWKLQFEDANKQRLIWSLGELPIAATIPEITIKAREYGFDAPAKIEAGLVSITLVNDGKEPHQAQLARLNEGITMEQLQEALKKGLAAALPLVALTGGPNTVMPGHSQQVTLILNAGQDVILCFVPDQHNVPHVAKGMIAPLEVVTAKAQSNAPEPIADTTVALKDFAIELPSDIKAGEHMWKVTNAGPQPHELTLLKLAEGKTLADVEAFLKSPTEQPPFEDAGGLAALAKGMTGWLKVDLQAGNYVALCFVPDPATGKAHAELGMIAAFTVK